MKRSFAKVLREENYKVLRKEKQKQEKAAMAAQQRKKRAAINKIMDLDDKKEDEVAKQSEEVVKEHLIENQYEQSIGKYVGGDWTDWIEVNPTDLNNTNLTLQQMLARDFNLNQDKSDGEDDTSSFPQSKRGLSPPVDPSPSKVFKQSESPTQVQPVKQD